jgi:transcriptional regulator with XRE-family HTH domain
VEALRRLRVHRGWSQQDLADMTGVAQDTISSIEIGRHEPRPSTLRKLAAALDVDVIDFFMEEPASPKASARGTAAGYSEGEAKSRLLREIGLWRSAHHAGVSREARRAHLDEIGHILDEVDELRSGLIAHADEGMNRAVSRLRANPRARFALNPYWEEVREADRLYGELCGIVQGSGLLIEQHTPSGATGHEEEVHEVTEHEAA